MVIKQEVLEKIINVLRAWDSKERIEADVLKKLGKEIREDLGIFITDSSELTADDIVLLNQALTQAKAIYDEENSNAN